MYLIAVYRFRKHICVQMCYCSHYVYNTEALVGHWAANMQTWFDRPGEIIVEVPNSLKSISGKYLNMGITATYDLVYFYRISYLVNRHLPRTSVQADNPWCWSMSMNTILNPFDTHFIVIRHFTAITINTANPRGRSLAGIADSNPVEAMDVCLLWM